MQAVSLGNTEVWWEDITPQKARAILTSYMGHDARLPRPGSLVVLPGPEKVFLTRRSGGYSIEASSKDSIKVALL